MKTETLNKLLVSPIPEISRAAHFADLARTRFENKELSESEFAEILEDITRLDKIDRNMVSVEQFNEIVKAFQIIMALKGLASLF